MLMVSIDTDLQRRAFNIHTEELIVIQKERDSYTFNLPRKPSSCLISRFVGEEKFVLSNTSDLCPLNSSVPEDLKQRLVSRANISSYMINNLTHSDSGLYQEECWADGKVTYERNITITVCSSIIEIKNIDVIPRETMCLPCLGGADKLNFQWLKWDYRYEQEIWTRMFGDNTASTMDTDRGRHRVVKNTSDLLISNISTMVFTLYTCLVMDQQQCVSSHPVQLLLNTEGVYRSVEDTAVLQCPVTDFSDGKPPYWKTDFFNIDNGQNNYTMVVMDQNYSLVLTSLMLNHSGRYSCNTRTTLKSYLLVVCPKFAPPAEELFSGGEEVTLRCKNSEKGLRHLWFFKSNRTKGRTFSVDSYLIKNMRSYTDLNLVIPNVSLQDTGEYWCAVLDPYLQCMFSTKTLLKYRDPFGVHSTFYAVRWSAFSVLLLALCAVVVTVTLWTRRRDS
ncbi:uncharacterized protein LOC134860067 [Eleginops maclovinus]|uniref:uncharacterized protein LOC134860067 n=1 Tax=Eleginops maclovinus TaxID=56733 RepID=UPI00307FD00D